MRVVYPVFIKDAKEGGKVVYVPDFDSATQGKDMADAIYMARDLIGEWCYQFDEEGKKLPKPSTLKSAYKIAKRNLGTSFSDFDGDLTLVDADVDEARRVIENRPVKKNCTIPQWMDVRGRAEGVNFSRVLQDALSELFRREDKKINA